MADSYNKKERAKKKQKRKKDKEEKREARKGDEKQTEVFMYVDIDGNMTSTPPDPALKEKFNLEDIEVSVPKKGEVDESKFTKTGIVKFFNTEKGYGFIEETGTRESFFVHIDSLVDPIKENNKVTFEVGKGPKGPVATDVKLV